jgi:hypothetical protein
VGHKLVMEPHQVNKVSSSDTPQTEIYSNESLKDMMLMKLYDIDQLRHMLIENRNDPKLSRQTLDKCVCELHEIYSRLAELTYDVMKEIG